ncbi:hypothetical protein HZZ00_10870 [Streptomyces sp. NEAU-sy36]|uniref:hypothetical protein n=1 Tax=unclassified Streptomyces TaxID=2593676 RepID=UPI0015D64A1B|nr:MULTISPECIES: hypothetical protein [unclassified Streptomyces]QLJ01472.1 hypothetical protein HZZ00_10870 [Streptomyces sp. NEAU-sy36]
MLRVVYEATHDIDPRQLVDITEARGRVTIKISAGTYASEFVPALNEALAAFVGECGWFQIWRGQYLSADSPDSPLTVQYVLDPEVDLRSCVQIREDCGAVRLHIYPRVPAELLVRVLNPAIAKFLAGGQWFQLWQGEIVTMDSPETVTV